MFFENSCNREDWYGGNECQSCEPHSQGEKPLKLQGPRLGDQAFSAPAIVVLPVRQFESGLLIKMSRGVKLALRPEHNLSIPGLAPKTYALLDQPFANPQTTRRGLNQ